MRAIIKSRGSKTKTLGISGTTGEMMNSTRSPICSGKYNRGYRDGYRAGYRDGYYDWVGWVPLGPGERYHGRTTVINNRTVIVNNDIQPRTLDSLRNHSAPGGISGLDGRQFVNQR